MNSKEWAEKVQVSDLYGSMWADVIADLAAAEERAERAEKARKEIEDCFLQGKVPLGVSMPQIDALAAKLEALRPYLRHKEGCEALGVYTDDCTCGLDALLRGGGKP